ncbi:MAG: hypothetical protein PHG51_06430 [Candidatus Omnitrophica bacterium]|nr:hypothetical protein [Candidatus Omnitrophota bacterium]
MSLYDYKIGAKICLDYGDDEFYGIIQAAMRMADTDNLEKLKAAFPEVWADLQARYKAPGGKLAGDPEETPAPAVDKPKSDCTPENPCCESRGVYNGFGSDGPLMFVCPKGCHCHD